CPYENIGLLPSTEDHFCINVRWFEDNRESDSLVRPQLEKCLGIFDKIAQTMTQSGISGFTGRSLRAKGYDFMAAQYLSFSLIDNSQYWLTEEEKIEMLKLRSTYERFKKINEYAEELLKETERRFKKG